MCSNGPRTMPQRCGWWLMGENQTAERLTWQEWNERLGAGIHDPDGFRVNPNEDGLYTQEEFYERWPACSILLTSIDKQGPLGHWTKVFGPDREAGGG
jgi:hypothetical protein